MTAAATAAMLDTVCTPALLFMVATAGGALYNNNRVRTSIPSVKVPLLSINKVLAFGTEAGAS